MGPYYELKPVGAVEPLGDVRAKRVARAPGAYSPPEAVVRVGPHKIADGPFVWYFLHAFEAQDLIHVVKRRAQAAVGAKNRVVNRSRQGEVVKELSEMFPHVRVAVLNARAKGVKFKNELRFEKEVSHTKPKTKI